MNRHPYTPFDIWPVDTWFDRSSEWTQLIRDDIIDVDQPSGPDPDPFSGRLALTLGAIATLLIVSVSSAWSTTRVPQPIQTAHPYAVQQLVSWTDLP